MRKSATAEAPIVRPSPSPSANHTVPGNIVSMLLCARERSLLDFEHAIRKPGRSSHVYLLGLRTASSGKERDSVSADGFQIADSEGKAKAKAKEGTIASHLIADDAPIYGRIPLHRLRSSSRALNAILKLPSSAGIPAYRNKRVLRIREEEAQARPGIYQL
jgi:hypothetical protein